MYVDAEAHNPYIGVLSPSAKKLYAQKNTIVFQEYTFTIPNESYVEQTQQALQYILIYCEIKDLYGAITGTNGVRRGAT